MVVARQAMRAEEGLTYPVLAARDDAGHLAQIVIDLEHLLAAEAWATAPP